MKTKFIITLLLIIINAQFSIGQIKIVNNQQVNYLNTVAKESVYIHVNTTLLFPGEQLYYSFYVLNKNSKTRSVLSKIGYIELVNFNGIKVFSHKINLKEGCGQGDFFVPTNLQSGSYKLLGYTNWMVNDGIDSFFMSPINIINPFKTPSESKVSYVEEEIKTQPIDTSFNTNNKIKAKINKRIVNKRESINMVIGSNDSLEATVSVSVRKLNDILRTKRIKTIDHDLGDTEKKYFFKLGDTIFLPEYRGAVLGGKIINKNNNSPIANKEVAISISGEYYEFKIVNTNKEGDFLFNIDKSYSDEYAFFRVARDSSTNYEIKIENAKNINYSDLKFDKLILNSKMEPAIKERSIHTQINNIYNLTKSSLIPLQSALIFNPKNSKIYHLDDYKRFSSFKETSIEILNNVYIEKNKLGNSKIKVRDANEYIASNYPCLILVDGAYIENHNDVININARDIKTITVLRDQYLYGTLIYSGVLLINTITGGYYKTNYLDYGTKVKLLKPERKKKYIQPEYDENSFKRLPDYRQQLYWEPNLKIDKENEISVNFYASDNVGMYEIVIEGFTKKGDPISFQKYLEVK